VAALALDVAELREVRLLRDEVVPGACRRGGGERPAVLLRDFAEAADRALRTLASRIAAQPMAVPQLLVALMFRQAPPLQIVLAGERDAEGTGAFLRRLHERFLPHRVVLLVDSDQTRARLACFAPEVAGMHPTGGKTTAYVCRDYACDLPTADADRFAALLKALPPESR